MKKLFLNLLILLWGLHGLKGDEILSLSFDEYEALKRSLCLVKEVSKEISEDLPLIYNQSLIGGYIAMPSAKMAPTGTLALGFSRAYPYHFYSLNFQMFKTIELVGNYRVYKGITETGFGHLGYGDDTDRTANIKFAIYQQSEELPYVPSLAVGFEDFYGSKRFYSFYACMTEAILQANLELTLGYGLGRLQGFYGAAAWTPFRSSDYAPAKTLSLLVEYDANNYENHVNEHPLAKKVKSKLNIGVSFNLFDFLQFKFATLRGNAFAASATLYYNIGESKGFLPKTQNPPYYTAPVNTESLGELRSEKELAQELAYAFQKQGLNLYALYLNKKGPLKTLWVKVINTLYREEYTIRDRLQYLLSSLIPEDIYSTTVVIEADGIPTQAYFFRTEDLLQFSRHQIGEHELEILSPLIEVPAIEKSAAVLYKRKKEVWIATFRPRIITFFGSTTGKIKYSAGIIAGPEGYLFDAIYYKAQVAYNISASTGRLKGIDVYNISHLPIVRSDSVLYFQGDTFALEQAYLQKGWNMGSGWFGRLALGYFEPAYGGASAEALYYPVASPWAVGFEATSVLKRKYHGIGFRTSTIQIDQQNVPHLIHFIGYQYFLDIYYNYRPWNLDFKIMLGQFLAKDKGARFEMTRYFPSGLRFSIWYTLTDGKDVVNYKRYYDKGISFFLPMDMFLKKSSRSMVGYATSAWLRDVGAQAMTGKKLYQTIQEERQNIINKFKE